MAEETERFTGLMASFAVMDEAGLRKALRGWCWKALVARDNLRHYKAGTEQQHDDAVIKLGRVQALVSVRRKTLRMADLISALREPCDDSPDVTP